MRGELVGIAALCALLGGSPSGGAGSPGPEWPGYRGPEHDGTSDQHVGLDQVSLKLMWTTKLAPGISSCAVVGDRLWTAGGGKGHQTVYALNAAAGEIIWQKRLAVSKPNRIVIKGTIVKGGKESPHEERVYGAGGVCGTPFVSEGKVYVYSPEADVSCLSADTGEVLWQRSLMTELPARSHHYGYCCSPIVVKGLLVVPVHLQTPPEGAFRGGEDEGLVIRGGMILALNADTGAEVWRNVEGACGWSTPTFAHIDGRDTIVQYSGTLVTGIDPGTGKTLWLYDPLAAGLVRKGKEGGEVGSGPAVVGNCVLFSSHALARTVCIRVENGETRLEWDLDASNYFVNGAAAEGLWFVAGCRGKGGATLNTLYCIDIEAGEVCWTESLKPVDGSRPAGRGCKGNGLMIAGDTLAVLTSSGELVLGRVSRDGFKRLTSVFVGSEGRGKRGLHTPPVLTGGRVYVRTRTVLRAFSLQSEPHGEQ